LDRSGEPQGSITVTPVPLRPAIAPGDRVPSLGLVFRRPPGNEFPVSATDVGWNRQSHAVDQCRLVPATTRCPGGTSVPQTRISIRGGAGANRVGRWSGSPTALSCRVAWSRDALSLSGRAGEGV